MTSPAPPAAAGAAPYGAPRHSAPVGGASGPSPAAGASGEGSPAASAALNAAATGGMRQLEPMRSVSTSAAVSASVAVSPAPAVCPEEQKSSTGTADAHRRGAQAGATSCMDLAPAGGLNGHGALHHRDAVDQPPEPQPAACTVPLQPPTAMPARERGGSVNSWRPGPGTGTAQLKHGAGLRLPEGEGEVQGGSNGRECSVEQRRAAPEEDGEREVQGGGGGVAGTAAASREGEGLGHGGRAHAVIDDGIVGGETDDLDNKMSVEMGIEVEGGEAMLGEVVQGGAGEARAEEQDEVGGRADAVIMRAGAGDEEEEVPSKPKETSGAGGDPRRDHAQGPSGGPPLAAEGVAAEGEAGDAAEVAPCAAAAVSATLGVAAGMRDGVGWPRAVPGSPRVSESGSGNGGVRDAWDNESEAFQGSAGVVERVERNDSAAGEARAAEAPHEEVGEISAEAVGARHEGAGEIGGAASRAASHARADSMFEGSGFLGNSPIFGAPQEIVEGNAASHAAGGRMGVGEHGVGGGLGWQLGAEAAGGSVIAHAPHAEGQGEIAGPMSVKRGREEGMQADAIAAHLSRAGRSGAGEVGLSEGAGEVAGGGAAEWDAGAGGAAHTSRGDETVVESALHAGAAAASTPHCGLWATPISSRNANVVDVAAMAAPLAERSGEGRRGSSRLPWEVVAPGLIMQHQASGNLGIERGDVGGTSEAATAAMAALRPFVPRTLSPTASADDVAAMLPGSGAATGPPALGVAAAIPAIASQRSVCAGMAEPVPPPWLVDTELHAAAAALPTAHASLLPSAPLARVPGIEEAGISILQVRWTPFSPSPVGSFETVART